jgi:hypothetical protein
VFRAFTRLGTHCRDGQRRERKQPREDLRLDRAVGSRAQEASSWGRSTSHFGVLVKAKLNLVRVLQRNQTQTGNVSPRRRRSSESIRRLLYVRICIFLSHIFYVISRNITTPSVMHVVIGIVMGHTSLMGRKVGAVTCAVMYVIVRSGNHPGASTG